MLSLLIISIILVSYLRYKPSFYITDDGDLLMFYWDRETGIKVRRFVVVCNITK